MEEYINVMGYPIFVGDISALPISESSNTIVATINPHSYVIAKSDPTFKKALLSSDFLLPDGNGIVLAANQIHKKHITKVCGPDLHPILLKKLNEMGGKCFYMGSSEEILEKIYKKHAKYYPNIIVEGYSPPFKDDFNDEDNNTIIAKVNAFEPDILFVGMTAPKQEKWLIKHRNDLKFKVAAPIGAVFDLYAEKIPNLDWLARFLKEPRRLWRRNLVSSPLFLLDMMLFKTGLKK